MVSRLSKNTKITIKGLATAYQAYVEALNEGDGENRDNGLCVWGRILIGHQRSLGVEMLETEGILIVVERAEARQAERRREVAA